MDYLLKIKIVRESIKDWQKENGNEFSYTVTGFYEGDDPIYDTKTTITKEEHFEIIKYLERRKFIKIISESKSSVKIKVLPKENVIIKLKTLELISRELKDHYTGYEIVKLLEECGVENKFIKYPTSKWLIFYNLFEELVNGQDEKAKNLLFKIISESVHPLNLGGNKELSENIVQKFNEYLKYDNLGIFYSDKKQKYEITNVDNTSEISRDEIMQDTTSLTEEILPDINKSNFNERVLELVADLFVKNNSEYDIRRIITPLLNKSLLSTEPFIKNYIDDFFDEKVWHYNFYSILKFIRRKDENADKTIAEIIEALLHPLNYKADEEKAENIAKSIGKYLKYNNFYVQNIGKEYLVLSDEEMTEIHSSSQEFNNQDKENKEKDEENIKENKENLKLLRDTHQSYIDILEIFCRNSKKPTKKLNDAYIFLSNTIKKNIQKIGLETLYYHISFYKPFENDLYSAEAEWNKKGKKIAWDEIRPLLYKAHSDITKLLNIAEENSNMTNEEKELEKINKIISEERITNEKKRETQPKPLQIEISKMPDLNIKNTENTIIQKGKKKIHLPKFKTTDWPKIEIRFLSERDVLITTDKKEVTPANYEILGFSDDKKNKPNTAWAFLLGLSKNNGETSKLPKPIPDNIRQQKLSITQKLKAIFNNETDPFYDSTETQTYKIKIKLIPPQVEDEKEDQYGTGEYLKDTMTEEYE